jgi:hypothetical protein
MHRRRESRSPITVLQNFCASASQAVRTAGLRSSGVAAGATVGAIKAMTMAMVRNAIIISYDICVTWLTRTLSHSIES